MPTMCAVVCGLVGVMALCSPPGCAAASDAGAGAPPIPRLEQAGTAHRLLVGGEPFLILGGQALNESVVKPEDRERIWKALTAIHANTAILPLHWNAIEPQPGRFDFSMVDELSAGARRHALRVVFLWFGTYKNGEMNWTPDWVKQDRGRYRRALGLQGEELNTISPHCAAALEADLRAFSAVMRHIREADEGQRTVIMIQVQNEPGLIGTDRDYSEEATQLFEAEVPAQLMAYLEAHRDGLTASLRAAWGATGFRRSGSWAQVFGDLAAEAFSAWHVARYVDAVAAAGKAIYPLPMFTNAWLIEPHCERAGRWPSGGPTEHVLDIWKPAAPHLDLIAPDIYYPGFHDNAAIYARRDNPLFVPEVNFLPFFGALAFMTFATFDGLAFAPYGIDEGADQEAWAARAAEFEDTYRVLQPLLPLVARCQGQGKLHAVIQGVSPGEDWMHCIYLGQDTVAALVEFTVPFHPQRGRGRGIIIELAPDDYIIAGAGFKVTFRELHGPLRDAQLLSLEEGTFEGGRWVRQRRLNGDELHVSLPAKAKILRARLAR